MQSCTCSYNFSPSRDYQTRTAAITYTIVVNMLTVIIGNRFMTIHVNVYSYACKWFTLDDTSDTDLHAILLAYWEPMYDPYDPFFNTYVTIELL